MSYVSFLKEFKNSFRFLINFLILQSIDILVILLEEVKILLEFISSPLQNLIEGSLVLSIAINQIITSSKRF